MNHERNILITEQIRIFKKMRCELYATVASSNSVSSVERLYSSVFPSDCFLWNIEVPNAEYLDLFS